MRPFKIKLKALSWESGINPRKWKPPMNSRIDVNAVRKWHTNFLVRHGVGYNVANFIQGRSPEDVRTARYLEKRERAIEAYSRIVSKILEIAF